MTSHDAIDRAYVQRERKRRADPQCEECGGEGVVSVSTRSLGGYRDVACPCLNRAGDFSERSACVCGGGYTFNFATARVYCRACEGSR